MRVRLWLVVPTSLALLLAAFIGSNAASASGQSCPGGVSPVIELLQAQEGGVGAALSQQGQLADSGVGNGDDSGEDESTDADPGFSGGTYTECFGVKNQAGNNFDKPQSPAAD
jgi:hypothetical protein